MAKKLILLVHGMGSHPKGQMTKEFKKALKDRAAGFGVDAGPALEKADIAEFNYSDYFDAIRQQFAQNAQARKKGFGFLAGRGFEEVLLQQLTQFEANMGKDEFFYTHWLDVVLYATMYFGEKIRVDFIQFFEKQRKKYQHQNIHIVCHSLGTALVHDALAKYYRKDSDPFDDIPDLKTGNFNIASLWTFANVSGMVNLLNNLADPLSSTVVTGTEGCTNNFINVRHKYDPFTWFKTYDRRMANLKSLTSSAIREVNTHDFYEYVTEPEVARAMLGFLYGLRVSDSQFADGVKAFKKDTLKGEVKDLRQLIDKLRRDPSITTLSAAIDQYKAVQAKIDELRDSLPGSDD